MNHIKIILACTIFFSNLCIAQFTSSNYGLKGKMGITLNHEYSNGTFENFKLNQHHTNFQMSFPVLLKIDTTSVKPKISLLKVEYTFRNTENAFSDVKTNTDLIAPNLYANSLVMSYTHTIGYPLFLSHSARMFYSGDYDNYTPVNFNVSSFFLYRLNKEVTIGLGALYLKTGSNKSHFLIVPFLKWSKNNNWFVDITLAGRVLFGKNIGKEKKSQIALATYAEFFTRYSLNNNNTPRIYESVDIATGIDYRTPIYKKIFLNGFFGNNFFKGIGIKDEDFKSISNTYVNSGLNLRLGFSYSFQ